MHDDKVSKAKLLAIHLDAKRKMMSTYSSDAIVKHLCARCNATLEVSDSSLGLVLAAHKERCFIAGDFVRWWPYGHADNPNSPYIDGRIVAYYGKESRQIEVITTCNFGPYDSIGSIAPGGIVDPSVSPGTIRRIPRPGQEVKPGESLSKAEIDAKRSPAPTLYDGLTAEECYIRWSTNRVHIEMHWPVKYDMTADQISAARWVYDGSQGARHSAQLRARIAASREVERTRVVLEQDAEDFEW